MAEAVLFHQDLGLPPGITAFVGELRAALLKERVPAFLRTL